MRASRCRSAGVEAGRPGLGRLSGPMAVWCAAGALVVVCPAAQAGDWATFSTPNLDRWNYPFNSQPSNRPTAPVFTTLGASGGDSFDDRDAEYLVGFATGGVGGGGGGAGPIPAGLSPGAYRIVSVTLRAMVTVPVDEFGQAQSFIYDPTPDPVCSYRAEPDCAPGFADDAGRPIELFAAGYRGRRNASSPDWGPLTFTQSSPFASQAAINAPAQGNRNVYPIDFDPAGHPRDASNNVTGTPLSPGVFGPSFEVRPLAVAIAESVVPEPGSNPPPPPAPPLPGQPVPDRTDFRFDVDLELPGVRAYVQQGLSQGQVNLVVTSLHPATAFGAGPVSYPVFVTRFNALGTAARLTVVYTICAADLAASDGTPGADGAVDNGDFQCFFSSFFTGCQSAPAPGSPSCGPADIAQSDAAPGPDGAINNGDFQLFFTAFFTGCG